MDGPLARVCNNIVQSADRRRKRRVFDLQPPPPGQRSVYLDLTRQPHELYKRMPKSGVAGVRQRPDGTEALVFDSLQLIRSAFTLSEAGYFSGKLWSNLQADAEKSLRKPIFRELWPQMKTEFLNDPSFVAYVERVQSR